MLQINWFNVSIKTIEHLLSISCIDKNLEWQTCLLRTRISIVCIRYKLAKP